MEYSYASLLTQISVPPGKIFVWDKDSTIANTAQRHHIIEKIRSGEATWVDYSAAAINDQPLAGTVQLMRLLPGPHIIVSGAHESARVVIEKWLRLHAIPWAALVLRPDAWPPTIAAYKAGVISELLKAGYDVQLCFEDFDKAAAAIEALGVPVLGVNPFYADEAPRNPEHYGNLDA